MAGIMTRLSSSRVIEIPRSEGGNMNRTFDKWTVDAAKYFKEEVLDIMPDIPREELCAMVGEYIYYQQADVGRDEARAVVKETCIQK